MISSVIKVWGLAFASAIPLGPVGLSIIRYTLSYGALYGVVAVMGAISADLLYALLAGFGATVLTDVLLNYQVVVGLLGGSLLIYLGLFFIQHPPKFAAPGTMGLHANPLAPAISTFVLTLANPMTMFAFLGIFSVVADASMNFLERLGLVGALVMGSFSWWILLVLVLHLARARVSNSLIVIANLAAGCLIAGAGLFVILRAINCLIQAMIEGGYCAWPV
ncbi:MAG: Lysine exporter protein (LYSE/YGGA) [candidate division TM6 bacterium GW2011_GWF2_43_17]|nr:MAG: Lysine exporter protein (LYSE/YGGA) [candidate division TM6 bacterium GW2011_GWF2_43_17]HAU30169.1 hypothetical protein [Candidatus Dependentiae bacterium]